MFTGLFKPTEHRQAVCNVVLWCGDPFGYFYFLFVIADREMKTTACVGARSVNIWRYVLRPHTTPLTAVPGEGIYMHAIKYEIYLNTAGGSNPLQCALGPGHCRARVFRGRSCPGRTGAPRARP